VYFELTSYRKCIVASGFQLAGSVLDKSALGGKQTLFGNVYSAPILVRDGLPLSKKEASL
jgi:hypothetical protein